MANNGAESGEGVKVGSADMLIENTEMLIEHMESLMGCSTESMTGSMEKLPESMEGLNLETPPEGSMEASERSRDVGGEHERLVVVANRLPLKIERKGCGQWLLTERGGGGLVSALRGVFHVLKYCSPPLN